MALSPVIAIVDDDREMREALCDLLLVERIACLDFETADAFLAAYTPGVFACVVTDLRMPGMSGLDLLAHLNRSDPQLPVIVVTSAADLQTRLEAMRRGARALLVKPLHNADLLAHLARFLD